MPFVVFAAAGCVRLERRDDAGAGRTSLWDGAKVAVTGFISPRTSCNCCCKNMVEEASCSQFGSTRPVIFVVVQEETGRGLPKGWVCWCWPVKWTRKP